MIKDRYLHTTIIEDLKEKMVFLAGPRQVGKTTLAKLIGGKDYGKYTYLNWDSREDRRAILDGRYQIGSGLIVFDEIHKYKKWKNHIKGEFDKYKDKFHILVTGGARLDIYRRGSDALTGRYHYYRLHPFSLAEIMSFQSKVKPGQELTFTESGQSSIKHFNRLFNFGGFPEAYLKKDLRTLRRFHNERLDSLVREDIRDLESLRDLSALQLLVELLPDKVGSLLSLNALRGDFQVTHKTIGLWMDILEKFYYHFRIHPFATTIIKSLRKEPKMYLWDWSQVGSEASRLENMVASHLLKFVHFLQDWQGFKVELRFLRDQEGREVDFLVTFDKKPWFAIEAKLKAQEISKHLSYFVERLNIPFVYQVVKESGIDSWQNNIRMISADKFLSGLV